MVLIVRPRYRVARAARSYMILWLPPIRAGIYTLGSHSAALYEITYTSGCRGHFVVPFAAVSVAVVVLVVAVLIGSFVDVTPTKL